MDAGDLSASIENVADDIVWHEIGSDEPIRGKQALIERYQGAAARRQHQGRDP